MPNYDRRPNTYKFARYEPCLLTIYNQEYKVLLEEPSLLALDIQSNNVLATGSEAFTMQGQSEAIIVGSPFKNGIVADFELATKLLQKLLESVSERKSFFFRPRIAACVAIDLTPVELQALDELLIRVGAKSNLIIEETFEKSRLNIGPCNFILEITPDWSPEIRGKY